MKIAQLTAFGDPAQVVECIEAEDPGAPGPGQVLVEMLCLTAHRLLGSALARSLDLAYRNNNVLRVLA